MDEVILQAHAKINLGLDTIRKREDGYHEVKMIMQSISLHDTLILRKIVEKQDTAGISAKTDEKQDTASISAKNDEKQDTVRVSAKTDENQDMANVSAKTDENQDKVSVSAKLVEEGADRKEQQAREAEQEALYGVYGADGIWLHNDGEENPDVPMDENNLIYKAIRMLKEEFGIPDRIEAVLTKRIPVAAGMAGGSTDAAAAFVGMNQLFYLELSEEELCKRAVTLGADIPYCIMGGTALSEGIGEILTPLPNMPDCWILIAKPMINVSTAFVYKNLKAAELTSHPDIDGMVESIRKQDLDGIVRRLENVLETVTIPNYPIIAEIKNTMLEAGAAGSLMSGSGPTVFGIFTEEAAAENAAEKIRNTYDISQVYVTRPHRKAEA